MLLFIRKIRRKQPVAATGQGAQAGHAAGGSGGYLHQPSASGQGTIPDLILAADEVIRLRAAMETVLARHTGQTTERLRRDTDRDRIFTPEQAVAYGLADEVLGG